MSVIRLLSSVPVLFAIACGGASSAPGVDSVRTSCEINAVLELVNNPDTSADDLKALGVYSRGATGIVDERDSGTVFTSMEQVDDVKYVGTSSMAALYDAVDGIACPLIRMACPLIRQPYQLMLTVD